MIAIMVIVSSKHLQFRNDQLYGCIWFLASRLSSCLSILPRQIECLDFPPSDFHKLSTRTWLNQAICSPWNLVKQCVVVICRSRIIFLPRKKKKPILNAGVCYILRVGRIPQLGLWLLICNNQQALVPAVDVNHLPRLIPTKKGPPQWIQFLLFTVHNGFFPMVHDDQR